MAAAAPPSWLPAALAALRRADALLVHAGAGLGVDSGLPDFRGAQGFWRAYPPMQKAGLSFAQCSNPASFEGDPRFGWGFFAHRWQLYSAAVPHAGYEILKRWSASLPSFVFTSNVDGHFFKANFDPQRVVEIHGSIHYLQPFDTSASSLIYDAAESLTGSVVSRDTFLLESQLPTVPRGEAKGQLARPNILMFDDDGWLSDRTDKQCDRHEEFLASLPKTTRVVVIEVGAGSGIPTIREASEKILRSFRNATLLRINPVEPKGPKGRTVEIPMGGKAALQMLDEALGGLPGAENAAAA